MSHANDRFLPFSSSTGGGGRPRGVSPKSMEEDLELVAKKLGCCSWGSKFGYPCKELFMLDEHELTEPRREGECPLVQDPVLDPYVLRCST
jgi:hypothetical protein